jgi:hypothetical protein
MPMACTVTHLSTWPTCEEQPQYLPKAQQPSPTPLQQDGHTQEGPIAGSSTPNCFKPPPTDFSIVRWRGTTAFRLMFTCATLTSLHIDLFCALPLWLERLDPTLGTCGGRREFVYNSACREVLEVGAHQTKTHLVTVPSCRQYYPPLSPHL